MTYLQVEKLLQKLDLLEEQSHQAGRISAPIPSPNSPEVRLASS